MYRRTGFELLYLRFSDTQIQIIIIFSTEKSMNTYLKVKNSSNTTQILKLKYIFIEFTAPTWIQK